jgi:hypothetical protein
MKDMWATLTSNPMSQVLLCASQLEVSRPGRTCGSNAVHELGGRVYGHGPIDLRKRVALDPDEIQGNEWLSTTAASSNCFRTAGRIHTVAT